jgi:hypothetical protein
MMLIARSRRSFVSVALVLATARAVAACGGDDATDTTSDASSGDATGSQHDAASHADASTASDASPNDATVDASPDTTTSDTNAPDTNAPDTSTPDTSTPDTSTPDTSTPDTSTPDTSTPDTSTPDTSTPDTSTPDTSTPDTSAPDTSAPDTSTPDAGGPGLRFVHLAPGAAPIDVCINKVGDPPATVPLFRSKGFTSGLAFKQISQFFAFDAGLYNLTYLPATATTCTPPVFGFDGNWSISAPATVAFYQYQFGAVPGYNGLLFDASLTPTAAMANVRVHHAAQGTGAVDVYESPNASGYTLWFSSLNYGASTLFHTMTPGNASFDVRLAGTSTSLTTFAPTPLAAEGYGGFVFTQSAGVVGLLLCADAPPAQGFLARGCTGP